LLIVCHSLAISTTSFRLWHRYRDLRLWWDDFWAAVALVTDIIVFAVYLIVFSSTVQSPPKPAYLTFALRWLTLICYTIALWAARMTVAVTIVRLHPRGSARRHAATASIIFSAFAIAMIIQKIVICSQKQGNSPRCIVIPRYTGILELVTNLLEDLWLLIAPASMLWKMKLQKSHRRLIFAIFLCGIFTALASIIHAVFILLNSAAWLGIVGHIEITVAIAVSNLLVLVTYIYRTFRS
ncbi:hypothetical protein CPC08DRAFT_621439, partial [Agrocybe pediades]